MKIIGYALLVFIIAMSGYCMWLDHLKETPSNFYHDRSYRIAAVQGPEAWTRGKYSGVDKRWLIQDLEDSTLMCEYLFDWQAQNWRTGDGPLLEDSYYFSHGAGDTITLTKIRKNIFFHVKRPKGYFEPIDSPNINSTK